LPIVNIRASRESSSAPRCTGTSVLSLGCLPKLSWTPVRCGEKGLTWTNNFIYMHPQQEADRTGIGGFTHTHIPVLHPSELWIGWDVSGRHLLSFKSNGSNRHTSLQGHCKSSCVSVVRAELGIADRGSCRIRATVGFNFMRLRIRFLWRLVALPA
jgi:hypothetical protein